MNCPTFVDIVDEFVSIIKDSELIAYNIDFDLSFINHELVRANYPSTLFDICSKISCTMALAKKKLNKNRPPSLDKACRHYAIDLSGRTIHSALTDAKLCAELHFKLIDDNIEPLAHAPQSRPHSPTKAIPIPRAYKDKEANEMIQLNFCKNSTCKNYGVPAKNAVYKSFKDKTFKQGLGNDYVLAWNSKKTERMLQCKLCGQSTTFIHNGCFAKEAIRVRNLNKQIEPSCPDEHCSNHSKGIFQYSGAYQLAGKTRADKTWAYAEISKESPKGRKPQKEVTFETMHGSQRILCKCCNKRFTVKLDPQQRHYLRELNEPVFKKLMNKGIINRIAEEFNISNKVIYGKIDFFYQQALAFDKYYSYFLADAVNGKTLFLSSDRQHYLSNWGDHNMPMPTPIINTTTADNDSGYVFASTVNFDFSSDAEYIKREHKDKKESRKASYYRRFAQYLLDDEDINEQSSGDIIDLQMQAPPKGLLVHQTYSILAHFQLLKRHLASCKHVNLFADNDSGFYLAINGLFQDWIEEHKLSAFQLTIERSGGQKLLDKSTSVRLQQRLKDLRTENPDKDNSELKKLLWDEHFNTRFRLKNSRSEWMVNPNPHSRFDGILPLTDISEMDLDEVISTLEKVSLNGVDNFFQVLRRHINMLERPVTSGTNSKRWNAYAGYNPEWMTKLLEIKRVYFNYCMTDERTNRAKLKAHEVPEPTTPAMRLGITNKVFSTRDILGFNPMLEFLYQVEN